MEISITNTFELWSLFVTLSSAPLELPCVEWPVWHNISGKWFAMDSDMWQRRISTTATTRYRPLRSLSASLLFICLSQKEVTNMDLFFSVLLPLSYQVRIVWIYFQSTSPGCHFVNGKNIYVWGFVCRERITCWFLRDLVLYSLLQITRKPYHSWTPNCLHFILHYKADFHLIVS